MAKKKKTTGPDEDQLAAISAGREFGISLKELETLMQTRGHEGVRELNEVYGGLSGLGQKLKTNLVNGKTLHVVVEVEVEVRHLFSSFRFGRRCS